MNMDDSIVVSASSDKFGFFRSLRIGGLLVPVLAWSVKIESKKFDLYFERVEFLESLALEPDTDALREVYGIDEKNSVSALEQISGRGGSSWILNGKVIKTVGDCRGGEIVRAFVFFDSDLKKHFGGQSDEH